jgi:hypothetical protein
MQKLKFPQIGSIRIFKPRKGQSIDELLCLRPENVGGSRRWCGVITSSI